MDCLSGRKIFRPLIHIFLFGSQMDGPSGEARGPISVEEIPGELGIMRSHIARRWRG